MASAQINPLADTPDRDLAAEYRELSTWISSIPLDQRLNIQQLNMQITDAQSTISTLETRLTHERGTRRPTRDVLARRDERGDGTEKSIAHYIDVLDVLERQREGMRLTQQERTARQRASCVPPVDTRGRPRSEIPAFEAFRFRVLRPGVLVLRGLRNYDRGPRCDDHRCWASSDRRQRDDGSGVAIGLQALRSGSFRMNL